MSPRQRTWAVLIATLILILLALNFLNFRAAQSLASDIAAALQNDVFTLPTGTP